MKKRVFLYSAAFVVLLAAAYFVLFGRGSSAAVQYDFATITRGDIESTISATGSLTPITSVQVGTQVSGTLDTVYADFNDTVKEGQIIAVLDTVLLKAAILDAQATVERAEAQFEGAQADYDRNKALLERTLISKETFQPFEINLKTQRASVQSAQAALQRAQRNLDYAVIKSPINGIVISRSIEAGQTVAASLSSPTLFVIAKDLSRMQILADVDESDIGQIKEGQEVRFEVAAYSGKKFVGNVKQVRLEPKTVSNVVTYSVVVEADNPDNQLLPGMTATLDFIIDKRTDALLVPNKALRYKPSEEEMAEVRKRREQQHAEGPRNGADSTGGGMRGRGNWGGGDSARGGRNWGGDSAGGSKWRNNMSMVWYLDSLGQLAGAPLQPGLTDGTNTEVANSRVLKEGMQIIIGTKDNNAVASRPPSAFGGQPGGGGGFRRGF